MVRNRVDEIQSIQIETTSRCNLDCVTCLKPAYRTVWQERDMDQRLFRLILAQIPAKVSIHLQGWGEPLLHPDTLSHIRELKAAGAMVSFTTSGSLMESTLAHALIDSGLDGLTFSMAGNCRSTQDNLRGAGSFAHLQKAIRTFISAKKSRSESFFRVAVSYLLTPQTVPELPGAISWCRKNGVDALSTVHLTQAGCRTQQKLQFMLSRQEARHYHPLRIQAQLRAICSKMRLTMKAFHPTLTPVCDKNPINSLFISADGEVSPCVFLLPPVRQEVVWYHKNRISRQKPVSFGNLRKTSLSDIWDHPTYRQFRDRFKERKNYHDQKLAGVSYSLEGSEKLDAAVGAIAHYLAIYPPPQPCTACGKLDGY
ncbi:MAG: radical SAM protein [Desulforhopalus sp.]